jgi:hypothetical protein
MNRLAAAVAATFLLGACGSGGSSAPPPGGPTVTDTRTFAGTTRANSPLSCGGDSHDFEAAAGTVSVTLVQSTGGVAMAVQVCAGGIDNNACTINLGPIAVGQTRTGTRQGVSQQNLKLMPANCGGNGPVPAGPVDYQATVTFQR